MIRVLVVDDDFMVARLHSSVVARQQGFEVAAVVGTGADAVRAVADLRPDLVLLDVYLPDMTGLEVLRRLRESGEEVDVVIISAARDLETLRSALRGGVFQYLVKPFDVESLRQRLREYALHHAEMGELNQAQQDEIDRVFRAPAGRHGAPPPKGISPETTDLVLSALRQAAADEVSVSAGMPAGEGMSASECADVTGLSRSSTRRYLEYLVSLGQAEMRPRYGVAGRPERRYRLR